MSLSDAYSPAWQTLASNFQALERMLRARRTRSLSPRVSPSRVPLALAPRTFKRRWLGDALIRISSWHLTPNSFYCHRERQSNRSSQSHKHVHVTIKCFKTLLYIHCIRHLNSDFKYSVLYSVVF